jgi:eukaryotic-like serine/threonine-protein kinase
VPGIIGAEKVLMSATGSSTQLAAGDVFAGKYRLERQFASGGMGFVWRAWNMQLDIPVAVKVMAAAMADSPDFVARFELEARAAAQIRSPHVVSVYEHGVHERLPYMVMELLEGEDLSHRLKREKRLSMSATAHIVRDMCKALHRAHELGIVHRDLKPANVFLARDGDEEIVKVLDFGIAKLTHGGGGNMTATGELMGTPNYMSPEHIRASKHVDHRADLWSVSIIAFRALTGQLPFTGPILNIVDRILAGAAPVPSTLAPDLSPEVDAFFARALARDIGHRFQSARELSEALGKLVGREPLVTASAFADTAAEPDERTTIPVPPPKVPQPAPLVVVQPTAAPPAPSVTVGPAANLLEMNTVVMAGRGSKETFNAAPGTGAARSKGFRRTLPLGVRASPPASAPQFVEAPGLAAPSPVARAASSGAGGSPRPRITAWFVVVVVVASALVVIAAAFWSSMHPRESQEPKPAPLPAASVH